MHIILSVFTLLQCVCSLLTYVQCIEKFALDLPADFLLSTAVLSGILYGFLYKFMQKKTKTKLNNFPPY